MKRRVEKIRLIDDSALAIQRVKPREEKPEVEFRSRVHKEWIWTLPCRCCDKSRPIVLVEAAHLRMWIGFNKGGATPDDIWMWPGCHYCHQLVQHAIGEPAFWQSRLGVIDPPRLVLTDYALKSPCAKTRVAATEEWSRRYG